MNNRDSQADTLVNTPHNDFGDTENHRCLAEEWDWLVGPPPGAKTVINKSETPSKACPVTRNTLKKNAKVENQMMCSELLRFGFRV